LLLMPCYLQNGNWTWTNVVYLWIQEEPQREYNNNKGPQIEHRWKVGVPCLHSPWLIINLVFKFMLESILVNMAKERKDMVKRTWNEIWFLVVDSWTLISNKDLFEKKNPKQPPLELISWSPAGVANDVSKNC
jgi:hypothetical protein